MIIDILAHYISQPVCQILERTSQYFGRGKVFGYAPYNADLDRRLGVMEKYGIDVQALSQTAPILMGFNSTQAAEICRISNNDNYTLCKAYPHKFVNICLISLLDMPSALQELDHAVNELDCRAVTVATNQAGEGLDSPGYFGFYEKLVEYDLPLFIHPINWQANPLVEMRTGWRMMHVFGWPFDTTQAIWRLIFGGVLDRYPDLKIITHHCGGMIPFFAARAEENYRSLLKDKLPRDIKEYWGNLYGDTALDGSLSAMRCGYEFFGPERMLYGTDYPFGNEFGEHFVRENLAALKKLNLQSEEFERIAGENARILLKIKPPG
jgi:predicted TIM-barrel fold metal-dependent hydrolase